MDKGSLHFKFGLSEFKFIVIQETFPGFVQLLSEILMGFLRVVCNL